MIGPHGNEMKEFQILTYRGFKYEIF